MNKRSIPKINSIHFGFPILCAGSLLGIIIPVFLKFVFDIFYWPICLVGWILLIGFGIVFAIEMHQDFGTVPYYKKRLAQDIPFDAENQRAIIKCSICTGEQIAGFKNKENGKFTEVMVIRSEQDLILFKKTYQLEDVPKEY